MGTRVFAVRGRGRRSTRWDEIPNARIHSNYDELASEFCFAMKHSREEIGLVVFDESVSLRQFIDFLSRPKWDFRGDILFIGDGDIFLSSVLAGDGRILYRLAQRDLDFYLSVKLKEVAMQVGAPEFATLHASAPVALLAGFQRGTTPFLNLE